jgi:hypothetical protein
MPSFRPPYPLRLACAAALLALAAACTPPDQLAEPVMEAPVVIEEPAPETGVRPPSETCTPSGDGIGGTGCPHI